MATNPKPHSIVLNLLLLLGSDPFLLDKNNKLTFEYIFQFGDSINDTGNLNWDEHNDMCGRYPYGMSLNNTSSRCSNGLLMIDYFAKFFNLTLDPYLEEGANLKQGVNFAVAGSTALKTSTLHEKHIISPYTNKSLSVQLGWFKSHLNSICNGTLECKEKLSKSIIFMGEIGGNDYNFVLMMNQKVTEHLFRLVPDVVQAIMDATKELIKVGARTIVIPGNFPIGCVPMYLSEFETNDQSKYDDLKCLKELNDFAKFHNDQLQEALKLLQQEFPHVTLIYADYFSALRWLIQNASLLGFETDDIQKACCGYGANDYNLDVRNLCGAEGTQVCADPDKRISWDGLHFTQNTYHHMAGWLLQQQIVPNILATNNVQIV